jgi:hypothetical protein
MISSTQIDLQAERDAVEAVIRGFGFECWRSETFLAPGLSSEEACQRMARECDIYIGVHGGRYGEVQENLGMSATEMEYRSARESYPRKVLTYLKEVDPESMEERQVEFLNEVQDFSSGYFRHKRFADLDSLVEQVKADILAWITEEVRRARVKAREVVVLRNNISTLRENMITMGFEEDLL